MLVQDQDVRFNMFLLKLPLNQETAFFAKILNTLMSNIIQYQPVYYIYFRRADMTLQAQINV